jgi:flagellar hook-length control protein FliK
MPLINHILPKAARAKDETTANALETTPTVPFASVLTHSQAQATTVGSKHQASKKTQQAKTEAKSGISLSFQSVRTKAGNSATRPTASARAAAGTRVATSHEAPTRSATRSPHAGGKAIHHQADTQPVATAAKSAWDQAQAATSKAAQLLPGNGSTVQLKPSLHQQVADKALPLDGKGVTERADGSPMARDADGTARVLDARDPDKSLGTWLKDEASDEEIDRFARDAARKAESRSPARTPEAFARRSEQLRAEAPVRLAEQSRSDAIKGNPVLSLNPQAPGDTRSATDQTLNHKSDADLTAINARTQTRGDQSDTRQQGGDSQQQQQREARTGDQTQARERETITQTAGDGQTVAKSATRTHAPGGLPSGAEGSQSVTNVDASGVAQALSQGARGEAAGRMATLLNARIDYMLNQQRPELRLSLTPRDMGAIQIRLINTGDSHMLRIHADRESTARVIELAAPQLAQQLQKIGVQVTQVAVDYGSTDFTNTGNGAQTQSQSQDGELPGGLFDEDSLFEESDNSPARPVATHDGELDVLA